MTDLQNVHAEGTVEGLALEHVKLFAKSCILFFKGCFKNNLKSLSIGEDLLRMDWEEEKVELVKRQWTLALRKLNNSSMSKTLIVNQLVSPDWRFGITAANKEVRNVGTSFLQLKLKLDKGNGETTDEYMGMLVCFVHCRA